jgi:MoaA/NifB/PqqE/SkfB family radical SAM enzyme
MEEGHSMKEWKSPFNSFNSLKALLYKDQFDAVFKKGFLPPIEASLDPIHKCNLLCEHCNAHRYLTDGNLKYNRMPDQHLLKLVEFLGKWGVKAICFGGGGEPTLHTALPEAIDLTRKVGMEASVATNGTLFNDRLISSLTKCKWVGISIDSATPETYKIGRKQDLFNVAINNISRLVDKKSDCDVAYKFLIMPYNQHEIYQACKLARELGVRDFHARPADFRHQGMGELKKKNNEYDVLKIKAQFEMCHNLETQDFRVFTVMHKFTDDFLPCKDFTQCLASPLCIQLCADGNTYFCVDQRHQPEYLLGTHYPEPENILKFWGGENHQRLVFGNTPSKCGTRCTFGFYSRMAEEVFAEGKDPFCKYFI